MFPEEERAEEVTEKAIRYFAKERQCRIFNLSLGSKSDIYRGGRQFPWAERLDELARELDIIIVISAGNYLNPAIPDDVCTREQFQQAIRDRLLNDEEQRICNPATAALALTVGALARSDALGHHQKDEGLRLRDAFAAAPAGAPAPFTRTGAGLKKASVKPDMVHYGGNYAAQALVGDKLRWAKHILLGEPTLQKENNGRFIGTQVGTSFSCPHITHTAAMASASLENAIGRSPSANLVRALVGSATVTPPCGQNWLGSEDDALRLVGYGMPIVDDLIWSKSNQVRLLAMADIGVDRLHLYRMEVPDIFLSTQGKRGITVALAYDPPVRASRQEYLARTMWVEALHGLTTNEVEHYRASYTGDEPPELPSGSKIELRPPRTKVEWSTLQVRKKEWSKRPQLRSPGGGTQPVIHLLVGCQQRFPVGDDTRQDYGLVVLFWHENERVELYQSLRNLVRVPSIRIRV